MLSSLKGIIRKAFPVSAPDPEMRRHSVAALEAVFFGLCQELAPDLFIEAGAKDATASRRIREYLPKARIVAFEANPYTFKRFDKKIDYRALGVEYRHRALSDSDGTVTFNVRVVDGRMSADGQGSILAAKRTDVGTSPVEVPSSRLDALFPPAGFGRCAIWMDVEGASREVLTGAGGLLDKVDVLFVEVEHRAAWEGQWLAQDVTDFLRAHDIVPVARDFQSFHQNNVIFVRRSARRQAGALAARLPRGARM